MDLDKLIASIQKNEGLRLKPYKDTTGHLTIGYGKNLDAGITIADANYFLNQDIQSCLAQAKNEPWWPVVENDDVRARALLEILFNLGLAGLHQFVHALFALCHGDFTGAANEFRNSDWYHQVGRRGEILTGMIQSGEDP